MVVIMEPGASREQIDAVIAEVERQGFTPRPIYGEVLTVVAVVGPHPGQLKDYFQGLLGVEKCVLIESPYKLVAKAGRGHLAIHVGEKKLPIGDGSLAVIAGPCSIESEEQLMACAQLAAETGCAMLRGGAFKPRTSPYSFLGLGEEGLKLLAAARETYGLPVVSEVMDPRRVELVASYCDMLQIGARNMQNFTLLTEAGKSGKPVMLKRGLSSTIEDLLNAAEYIAHEGNEQILLCERGIRTFETSTRNTLDVSAVPVLHQLTHLPVCLDPSHGVGERDLIPPVACACAAVGADAMMIEFHPNPPTALSDGGQSLDFDGFRRLMAMLDAIPRFSFND